MEGNSTERAKAVVACRAFVICLTALCASATSAGVNTWTSIGPDGGRVGDVEFHSTIQGTLYAAASSGLYRSTDFGQTWSLLRELLNTGSPIDIEMDPNVPDTFYVGTGSGSVEKSLDGGSRFASGPVHGPYVRVKAARDGNTVYATHGASVYRSVNGGQTWESRSALGASGYLVHGFAVDPQNANTVYASMYPAGFFRSTDGAATWDVINMPAALQLIYQIAVDPLNSQRIWVATTDAGILVSSDRGSTWTQRTPANNMYDVKVHPSSPDTIFATSHIDGRVWKSMDAGLTWALLPVSVGLAGGITINPTKPEQVAVTGDAGVFVSTNSGGTWTSRGAGIKASEVYQFIRQPGSNRIYLSAAPNAGLHWITENGESTERVNDFALTLFPFTPPLPRRRLIAATSTTFFAAIDDRHIARTQSQGSLWIAGAPINSTGVPPLTALVASLTEPLKVFAGTSSGLYISNNGGDQWMHCTSGIPAALVVRAITVTPNPSVIYVAGEEYTGGSWRNPVLRSLDGGLTWSTVYEAPSSVSIVAIHPVDSRILFVGTIYGLRKSVDDGATWTTPEHPVLGSTFYIDDIAFDPGHPNIMYISRGGGVIRSVDSGATWHPVTWGDSSAQFLATKLQIDPLQPSRIYAGSRGWGVRQITLQPDLSVAVSSVSIAAPNGATTSFSVDVRNTTRLDVTDVRVTLQASASATGMSASVDGVACPVVQQTATCTLGVLRGEALSTIAAQATAGDGGLQLTASVQAAQPDSNAANSSATKLLPAQIATTATPSNGGGGGGAMSVLAFCVFAPLMLAFRNRGASVLKRNALRKSFG
jgi:Sortilin, neurotensin receptor 3,/Domain of unknown function DUF11